MSGLGFYHIPHPPLSRKKDSKTALVSVVGSNLSGDQLVAQLQRIVSSKWNWEPVVHEQNSFIVAFPSKNELQRAIAFGGADVRDKDVPMGTRMQFEEWHEEEEGFLLPKVWIRVTGIRKKLREFLNLWAIGSMLGSTQTVDMETTRKNNFGRVLVAVLDPKLLPTKLDAVIGDHYFELRFEVESVGFDENGDEVNQNFGDGNDGDNEDMDEDDPIDSSSLDREGKRSKKDLSDNQNGSDNSMGMGGAAPGGTSAAPVLALEHGVDTEEKIRKMANEIMDMAVDMSLDFCVDKVLAEEDGEYLEGAADGISIDMVAESPTVCPMKVVIAGSLDGVLVDNLPAAFSVVGGVSDDGVCSGGSPSEALLMGDTGATMVAADLVQESHPSRPLESLAVYARRGAVSAPPCSRRGLQQPGLGALSSDMLVAAAGIKEVVSQPTRSSPRLAGGADHHILEKAKLRAAWRNLDGPGNSISSGPFSLPNDVISTMVSNLGVSLGSNQKQVSDSVSLLNRLELHNSEPQLDSSTFFSGSEFVHCDNDEVDKYESDNLALGHLCGDFVEEVMDEDSDHLSCDFHTVFKKNKSKGSSRSKGSIKIKLVKKHKRCTK